MLLSTKYGKLDTMSSHFQKTTSNLHMTFPTLLPGKYFCNQYSTITTEISTVLSDNTHLPWKKIHCLSNHFSDTIITGKILERCDLNMWTKSATFIYSGDGFETLINRDHNNLLYQNLLWWRNKGQKLSPFSFCCSHQHTTHPPRDLGSPPLLHPPTSVPHPSSSASSLTSPWRTKSTGSPMDAFTSLSFSEKGVGSGLREVGWTRAPGSRTVISVSNGAIAVRFLPIWF